MSTHRNALLELPNLHGDTGTSTGLNVHRDAQQSATKGPGNPSRMWSCAASLDSAPRGRVTLSFFRSGGPSRALWRASPCTRKYLHNLSLSFWSSVVRPSAGHQVCNAIPGLQSGWWRRCGTHWVRQTGHCAPFHAASQYASCIAQPASMRLRSSLPTVQFPQHHPSQGLHVLDCMSTPVKPAAVPHVSSLAAAAAAAAPSGVAGAAKQLVATLSALHHPQCCSSQSAATHLSAATCSGGRLGGRGQTLVTLPQFD